MDELFSKGALPIGMLFFAFTVLSFLRRKAGHVVARAQYPALGERLGLKYTPSDYKTGVGKLEGRLGGFFVIVDPDDQRRILVRFEGAPDVELHSYVHNKRSKKGQRSFRPSNPVLLQMFRTAHASPELREKFQNAEELPGRLKPLKFLRQLKTLSVTTSGVVAVFDYGTPPYIPAEVVEDVLPRLLALASVFEASDNTPEPERIEDAVEYEPAGSAQ